MSNWSMGVRPLSGVSPWPRQQSPHHLKRASRRVCVVSGADIVGRAYGFLAIPPSVIVHAVPGFVWGMSTYGYYFD
jgi:hypothetical protein